MIAEPRLAVLLVRIALESRIRLERRGGPLPDVAEHLAAAPRTVELAERGHVDGVTDREPQVPGDRRAARRDLPLGLGRQPPPGPPAPRLGFVGAHVDHRPGELSFDRHPAVVGPALPAPVVTPAPVDRTVRADSRAPLPAVLAPQRPPLVAAVVDECGVLALRHRRARDREPRQLDVMRPLLVV